DENAFQEEVDEAYDGLARAYLSLRLIPNKDLLNDLINKANGLNSASYSPESWAAVSLALENANETMANVNATEEEVNAAVTALNSAIEGLVANTEAPVETEVPSTTVNEGVSSAVKAGDTTASIKTGDSASLGYSLAGLAIASVVLAANKKRRAHK
ncbi:LPXTG cell wall anchor domain-containing protein, partial [Thomasclavelia saccharogumia]|uniref:LPXTG cell wall anchor domain-containing protein n=1 Tax=Thomasclavelia saccharogumia TaxID=341225 RepID=UPI00047A092B